MAASTPRLAPVRALLLAPLLAAAGVEAPLAYLRYPEVAAAGSLVWRGTAVLEPRAAPPAGDWTLPALQSPHPVFAEARLGDRRHLLVVDVQRPESPFYDRLWFDADADGDLAEETPRDAEAARLPGTFRSPPVDLTVVAGGAEMPYSLRASAVGPDLVDALALGGEVDVESLALTLEGNCAYTATLALDGTAIRFLLADGDVDGRFDTRFALGEPAAGDPWRALVATGDRLFATAGERLDARDEAFLGRWIGLGGRVFTLAADAAGGRLSLAPLAAAAGRVPLVAGTAKISFVNEEGDLLVHLADPAAAPPAVDVPAGRWRVAGYQLYRADADGDRWSLSAAATPRSAVFTVSAGETAAVPYGEPFHPAAAVPRRAYELFAGGKTDRVDVEFTIGGAGGEVVNDLRRVAGRATKIPLDPSSTFPAEPRYRILEPTGKIVAQGAFEYG
ncbi:MAG: hypothetical protein AB1726_09830 [Planctomycetota bacterium]